MIRTAGTILAAGLLAACATVPKTAEKRMELDAQADNTLQDMLAKNPQVGSLLDQSAGYVVFPEVKQGGAIIGGAGGRGVVYQQGKPVGYAQLSQASIGAQLGGQKFAELVIVRDQATLDKMRGGDFDIGGQVSAVILKQGAGEAAQFSDNGVAVVIQPLSGAMINVSVSGQRLKIG